MQSLQKNVLSSGEEAVPYDNIFLWNAYLTQPIRSRCNQQHYLGILSRYSLAVGYLNSILHEENHLKFIHWDFHKFAKRELSLRDLRAYSVELTRGESSNDILTALANREKEMKLSQQKIDDGTDSSAPLYQSGVLRTNCIDCLDRTNVVGRKLHAMGLSDTFKIDPNSSIAAAALMDMYQSMGDALAQQYGGSAAHNTVFPERQGKWKATTQSREFLKSIQRYYSNTYTDDEKQDAINLFLGYIQPQDGKPALWELDSDYFRDWR
ncbi:unnamed protein product [Brassica oleracea]